MHWSLSSFRAAGIKDRPSKAIFGCWLRRRSTYMNSAISSQMLRLAVPPPWKKYHGCKTTPSTSPVVSTWSRNIQSTELGTIQFVSAFFSTKYRTTSCLPPSTSNDVKYTIHRKSLSLSLDFLCTSYLWHLIIWITLTQSGHYVDFLWIYITITCTVTINHILKVCAIHSKNSVISDPETSHGSKERCLTKFVDDIDGCSPGIRRASSCWVTGWKGSFKQGKTENFELN